MEQVTQSSAANSEESAATSEELASHDRTLHDNTGEVVRTMDLMAIDTILVPSFISGRSRTRIACPYLLVGRRRET
ncbi:MAG: hypothetical protein ABR910_01620 [Acidobacteriaceae bacterium]|jgi:hypothetical protein